MRGGVECTFFITYSQKPVVRKWQVGNVQIRSKRGGTHFLLSSNTREDFREEKRLSFWTKPGQQRED